MIVKEALKKYSKVDETELFLSHLLKCSKTELFANPERNVNEGQIRLLDAMIHDFLKGKPAAYILGYKYFFGLKFKVDSTTLIPRPESEWLVNKALEFINNHTGEPLKLLDIGTGSGCLAISIAKNADSKQVNITASDISRKALEIAKGNARTNKVHVNFIYSDLLEKTTKDYDLIVANLPYVPIKDYGQLKSNLKYEPILALTDGTDDFILYEKFLHQLDLNKLPKLILFEIDPATKPFLEELMKKSFPQFKISFEQDLKKLWRYAILES